MRISDWSSDVCSSDLEARENIILQHGFRQVSEEEIPFFFIDIEAQRPILPDFSPAMTARVSTTAPRPVLISIAPSRISLSDFASIRRSEERRVGHEGVRTCISRWLDSQSKKKN